MMEGIVVFERVVLEEWSWRLDCSVLKREGEGRKRV